MTLTRRDFFCALAASAVAAGVPLPVGVEPKIFDSDIHDGWINSVYWFSRDGRVLALRNGQWERVSLPVAIWEQTILDAG